MAKKPGATPSMAKMPVVGTEVGPPIKSPALKANAKPPSRRKVQYSRKIMNEICDRLATGEAWSRICLEDGMPAHRTLYDWQKRYPEAAELVIQARMIAVDMVADEVMDTARKDVTEAPSRTQARLAVSKWLESRNAVLANGTRSGLGQAGPAGMIPVRRLELRVRQFERAVDANGVAYLKELLPREEVQ